MKKGGVPDYLLGNMSWYDATKNKLCNYMGYELHLCEPKDYMQKNYWFDKLDWKHIANIRSDFAILPYDTTELTASEVDDASTYYQDFFNQWIDFTNSSKDLIDGKYRIYKLKKYIPTHYTGGNLALDSNESMDNGYFYCPDLTNGDILSFSTNDYSKFEINLNSKTDTDVAFLFYPNRYYKYYVDGNEIDPVIDDMEAFIPITSGNHTIKIEFKNYIQVVSLIVMMAYYIAWLTVAIINIVLIRRKRNR